MYNKLDNKGLGIVITFHNLEEKIMEQFLNKLVNKAKNFIYKI